MRIITSFFSKTQQGARNRRGVAGQNRLLQRMVQEFLSPVSAASASIAVLVSGDGLEHAIGPVRILGGDQNNGEPVSYALDRHPF